MPIPGDTGIFFIHDPRMPSRKVAGKDDDQMLTKTEETAGKHRDLPDLAAFFLDFPGIRLPFVGSSAILWLESKGPKRLVTFNVYPVS